MKATRPNGSILGHEPGVPDPLAGVVDHRAKLMAGGRTALREELRERCAPSALMRLGREASSRTSTFSSRVVADRSPRATALGRLVHRFEPDHGVLRVASEGVIR